MYPIRARYEPHKNPKAIKTNDWDQPELQLSTGASNQALAPNFGKHAAQPHISDYQVPGPIWNP